VTLSPQNAFWPIWWIMRPIMFLQD
jgi:hypothetical protein